MVTFCCRDEALWAFTLGMLSLGERVDVDTLFDLHGPKAMNKYFDKIEKTKQYYQCCQALILLLHGRALQAFVK